MKLIVGLGNPGKKYEKTRHNSGFLAMDYLAKECGCDITQEKWNALICMTRINGEQVILMKPQTYMNESGNAVIQAANYYHLDAEDILVLHDDMDLPVGSLRIRTKGSSGGQRGMQSIINHLGTSDFPRIRIGVGHSDPGVHDKVPDWVLSPVSKADTPAFEMTLQQAAKAAYAWVNEPMERVMQFNIKEKKKKEPQE